MRISSVVLRALVAVSFTVVAGVVSYFYIGQIHGVVYVQWDMAIFIGCIITMIVFSGLAPQANGSKA